MANRLISTREDPQIKALLSKEELTTRTKNIEFKTMFGRNAVDERLDKMRKYFSTGIEAKSLEFFWNFNRKTIQKMFAYNPVEQRPKLSYPNENRVDATEFSIVLASVIQDNDEITLLGRGYRDTESPLTDNLGAYIPRGKLTIIGETGDGTAHHAGASASVRLQSPTGENLGFGSEDGANIYAGGPIGEHPDKNVVGPFVGFRRLHQ